MVNGKKFPYTAKGKKAAKAYAMGEKMESKAEKRMEMKILHLLLDLIILPQKI